MNNKEKYRDQIEDYAMANLDWAIDKNDPGVLKWCGDVYCDKCIFCSEDLEPTYCDRCKIAKVKWLRKDSEIETNKGLVTLCEVGVLLDKSNKEYGCYNEVWTKDHGFYNENDILFLSEDDAEKYAMKYVQAGVDNTYAIVSNEGVCEWDGEFDDGNLEITAMEFAACDIIYNVAKINGKIVENFLGL